MKEKQKMTPEELRKQLINSTGLVWELSSQLGDDWTFKPVDINDDLWKEEAFMFIRYKQGENKVSAFSMDDRLLDQILLIDLKKRLKLVCEYAKFANGFDESFPEAKQSWNANHCRAMTDLLIELGIKDPAYISSDEGIEFWLGDGFLVEYDLMSRVYLLRYGGEYWASADPISFIEQYSDVQLMVKQWKIQSK